MGAGLLAQLIAQLAVAVVPEGTLASSAILSRGQFSLQARQFLEPQGAGEP